MWLTTHNTWQRQKRRTFDTKNIISKWDSLKKIENLKNIIKEKLPVCGQSLLVATIVHTHLAESR